MFFNLSHEEKIARSFKGIESGCWYKGRIGLTFLKDNAKKEDITPKGAAQIAALAFGGCSEFSVGKFAKACFEKMDALNPEATRSPEVKDIIFDLTKGLWRSGGDFELMTLVLGKDDVKPELVFPMMDLALDKRGHYLSRGTSIACFNRMEELNPEAMKALTPKLIHHIAQKASNPGLPLSDAASVHLNRIRKIHRPVVKETMLDLFKTATTSKQDEDRLQSFKKWDVLAAAFPDMVTGLHVIKLAQTSLKMKKHEAFYKLAAGLCLCRHIREDRTRMTLAPAVDLLDDISQGQVEGFTGYERARAGYLFHKMNQCQLG
ncbi:MAG: hypothetical protein FWF24_03860 [Alphaproteobacteria bacterium]|nr:hypothetical protein [Alphaproteobacteria bacterium]